MLVLQLDGAATLFEVLVFFIFYLLYSPRKVLTKIAQRDPAIGRLPLILLKASSHLLLADPIRPYVAVTFWVAELGLRSVDVLDSRQRVDELHKQAIRAEDGLMLARAS